MTALRAAAAIAVMAVVTFLTRALPFLLFGRGGNPPRIVLYLGKYLPPAVIAMLIVYCLRGVSFGEASGWAPALIACLFTAAVHIWKKNNMLSIVGGTILYMILIQVVFA
jgi:branched-subunit amino acid transport protein AzlD